MENIFKKMQWEPPEEWIRIRTLDAHTAGEPLRIILSGYPELPGKTILEKRRAARDRYDHLRTALMWEPRGHADMYGCIVTPAESPEADFGVIFMHNEGYSTMCGHAIIALTKAALETGVLPKLEPETVVRIDTPAGMVTAHAEVQGNKIGRVRFQNVPSFVLLSDEQVNVPGLGTIPFDVAFGGAFYAFVDADRLGIKMIPDNYRELIDAGMRIKHAVMETRSIRHPFSNDLSFLYGTIFIGKGHSPGLDSRNVCIFAEGEVDRSPTGTGVSARMALHFQRGEIEVNQPMVIESLIGSTFTGRVVRKTEYGPHPAVIPEVEGNAYLTGQQDFFIDPADGLQKGFILR